MALTAGEKISKAKTKLVLSHPFFAVFVLKLKFIEDERCPTMWTDGKSLGYGKAFVENLTVDEAVGVIVHELEHITFLHPLRMGSRNKIKWNVACDLAINQHVLAAGFKLPEGVLNDPKFRNMEAEKIYNKLPEMTLFLVPGQGECGIGEVRTPTNADGSALSESQIKEAVADIKTTIAVAAQLAKKQGNLPAGFERWIKEILEPKINWKAVLQEFVTQSSRNDYSWKRPNRRFIQLGTFLPILEKPELGELVVAIDTSGSLNDKELAEIASEVRAIMSVYSVKLYVIYCDSSVHPPVDEFTSGEDVEMKMRGGGGTDYRPVFKYIEKETIQPVCLLYFTDGCCDSFPKTDPGYRTLWVLTEKNEGFKNPFGDTTYIRYGKED